MKLDSLVMGGAAELVRTLGDAIDRNVTNDEERGNIMNATRQIVSNYGKAQMDFLSNRDQEVSKRWESDMQSDSWLSKNIRPMVLIFLTLAVVFMAGATIFAPGLTKVQVSAIEAWIPLFTVIMSAAYAAYFGGRSIEKIKQKKYMAANRPEIKVSPQAIDKVNELEDERIKKMFGNLDPLD